MHEAEQLNLDQIQAFLKASEGIRFEGKTREQIYHWVEKVLVHHQYQGQKRSVRGLLRRYAEKMTGLSRAQVTRLIRKAGASQSPSINGMNLRRPPVQPATTAQVPATVSSLH